MTPRARSRLLFAAAAVAALAFAAGPRGRPSSRPPIHLNSDMDLQPRSEPQAASAFFYDGAVFRAPVAGTVARGELRDNGVLWTGMDPAVGFAPANPLPVDDALRERGRRRYDIYCAVCHDKSGDGKGVLWERAQVRTPSYHVDRLRQAPDGYYFLVITNGFGLMPAYNYPLPVADRWAIVAHIRELQAQRVARDAAEPGVAAP